MFDVVRKIRVAQPRRALSGDCAATSISPLIWWLLVDSLISPVHAPEREVLERPADRAVAGPDARGLGDGP